MNKAIFIYTLYVRMRSIPVLWTVGFFSLILPIILSVACTFGAGEMELSALTMVLGAPAVAFVLAFTILRDSFADTRHMSDGEYLTLLFTRPVSRAEYVISKWLATSCAVTAALSVQIVVFHFSQSLFGVPDKFFWNAPTFANIVLNSFSSSALISAINAFPRKYAIYLFLLTSYSSVLGRANNSTWRNESAFIGEHRVPDQVDFPAIISALLNTRIDAFNLLNAVNFPWSELVSYASNLSIYLLIAVVLLTRREFFYGSE